MTNTVSSNAPTELSTDIHVITAEIKLLMKRIEEDTSAIGERLKRVRDDKLADSKYGNWGTWCRGEFSMDRSTANKIIKVYEIFGNGATSPRLGTGRLFEIIALPPEVNHSEFIAQPHTIPSTGATKTVDEMTVRELCEVKKALKEVEKARKEAEARAEKAEEDYEVVRDTLEAIEAQPPKVVADPTLSDRLKRYETRYGDIDGEVTVYNTLLFGNKIEGIPCFSGTYVIYQ